MNGRELTEKELEMVSGGWGARTDQYVEPDTEACVYQKMAGINTCGECFLRTSSGICWANPDE